MDNIGAVGRVHMPFRMWIEKEKFQQLRAFEVRAGDVLISRAGTVGKMCVAPTKTPASVISTNLIRVRFGSALLPEYFVALMTFCKGRVGRLRTGPDGAFTHMSTTVLDSLEFPYPPINRQTEFRDILAATDQYRAKTFEHLACLEEMFVAVQARAFAGEL